MMETKRFAVRRCGHLHGQKNKPLPKNHPQPYAKLPKNLSLINKSICQTNFVPFYLFQWSKTSVYNSDMLICNGI